MLQKHSKTSVARAGVMLPAIGLCMVRRSQVVRAHAREAAEQGAAERHRGA